MSKKNSFQLIEKIKKPNLITHKAMEQARKGKATKAKNFDEIRDRVHKAQRFLRARCCDEE